MTTRTWLRPQPDTSVVYTVSRFNAEVKRLLLDRFKLIWLEGEISNLSQPGSGHIYFSLKDDACQIQCAMFRTKNRYLDFEPKTGLQVLVQARPDLYETRGSFQLVVNHMEISGHGDLYARFERTKRKLEKEGLLDPQRKRPIPPIPRRVGVITSADGAALHDVLTTLDRRFPTIEVFIYPTQVQGDKAPESICSMIETANARCETDILVLVRGGGSIEDLWAFNEEQVARSIGASKLPIVTGIGHETDFTIADFVADERAPTPTAAAQRVSPDRKAMLENTIALSRRLESVLHEQFKACKHGLALSRSQLLRFHPMARIEHWVQRMDNLSMHLLHVMQKHTDAGKQRHELARSALIRHAPFGSIDAGRIRLRNDMHKLRLGAQRSLERRHNHLEKIAEQLRSLNPLSMLKRGYSITTDSRGKTVRSVKSLAAGQKINIRVEKGEIDALVEKLRHRKRSSGTGATRATVKSHTS